MPENYNMIKSMKHLGFKKIELVGNTPIGLHVCHIGNV